VIYLLGQKDDVRTQTAVEHLVSQAQITSKVIQTRALSDKIKHNNVFKNVAPQLELVDSYKKLLKQEIGRVDDMVERLNELDDIFTKNAELSGE